MKTGDGLAYGITLLCVVFLNLLEEVFIGLALASAIMLWRVTRPSMRAEQTGAEGSARWRVIIEGSCSFLSLPRLTLVLNSVPSGTDVIVELHIDFLDHSVFETMNAWRKQHISTGGSVHFEEHGNTAFSDAASTPPKKEQPRTFPLAPRKAWQDSEALPPVPGKEDRPEPVQSLLLGIDKYHRRHAELVLPLVEDLAETQNPDTLFLTCVDSRVNPNLITSSGPGDLLTLRNIGNVVCADNQDPSIESALSFAVQNLSITSIVICGHSNCGAMKAVLADPDGSAKSDRSALDVWIDHARRSYDDLTTGHPVAKSAAAAGYGRLDQLSMVNVAAQMRKLENHHLLGPALATGRVHVTGLFYDISSARVLLIKPEGIEKLDPLSEQKQEIPVPV